MTLLVFTYLLSGCSPKDTQTMAQAAAVLDQGDQRIMALAESLTKTDITAEVTQE